MNADTAAKRAYIDQLINRLRRQYEEQRLLPAREEGAEGEPLSMSLLQRLYRHVLSEGYGE
ncbi:MAG TPA: hypothetical protein PLO33_11650 [Kouleothrix sp.]|uniref:hypothetical protein n=1 Tax=Kouleothrix sp. TaxID=2779161 RepID=UPI002CCC7977|nr:hypothetical protein [Kouleothrix sp.]HRC76319.1 hypothetical protein [Kouleothrix sp.]